MANLKHCLPLLLQLSVYIPLQAQNEVRHYKGEKFTADYTLTNGMLNGKCTSYYKNGIKKAEGDFQYNNRIGKWDAYDSTGKLVIERVYTNVFEYTVTVSSSAKTPVKFNSSSVYVPTRDTDGCYKYFYLHEPAVVWSKRTWMYLFNIENPVLSENNRLFKILYEQALGHAIKAYKCYKIDDKTFIDTLDLSKSRLNVSHLKIIGFITKQDWLIDTDRHEMEYRILGICPIAKRSDLINDTVNRRYLKNNAITSNDDTVGLFWIYYPQVRKYFAQEKVSVSNVPYIKNLDDVFFWKYLNGRIFGESGIYGVAPVNDSWALIMKMIDLEHNFWMGMQ